MPAIDLTEIVIGGPCKIVDGAVSIYTEDDVILEPVPTFRDVASSVGGAQDSTLTDLMWKMRFIPKSVWTAAMRGVLLPAAYYNFATTGARIIGAANRAVSVIGADGNGFDLTRAGVTKMPDIYMGLGKSLYGQVEYTAFIGQGKQVTDADAFMAANATAWDQSDFPAQHQEALCQMAWGAVAGWQTVFAEEGFQLAHELKLDAVKQGNITVDMRVTGYRAMLAFKPQGPTAAQLLTAAGWQGNAAGIGSRLSSRANDAVVTGSGISVTVKSAAPNKGPFAFSNKLTRLGEIGMITALTVPGNRLAFA